LRDFSLSQTCETVLGLPVSLVSHGKASIPSRVPASRAAEPMKTCLSQARLCLFVVPRALVKVDHNSLMDPGLPKEEPEHEMEPDAVADARPDGIRARVKDRIRADESLRKRFW
jgi:hypothetical protein